MEDLQYEAEIFSASYRLQHVAIGLKRKIDGQQIDESEKGNFEWVANLVGRMDFDSEHYKQGEHPELCLIATQLRPEFYRALLRLGITDDAKFPEALHKALESYGGIQLDIEELKQSHQLVQSMATNILTKMQYAHGIGQI